MEGKEGEDTMDPSTNTADDMQSVYSSLDSDEDITYSKLLNVLHVAGLSILVYALIALGALM